MGLTDSKSGLRYGVGLNFEQNLGGNGLTNPGFTGLGDFVRFVGAGILSVSTRAKVAGSILISGAGTMSITFGQKLAARVGFAGTGGVSKQ